MKDYKKRDRLKCREALGRRELNLIGIVLRHASCQPNLNEITMKGPFHTQFVLDGHQGNTDRRMFPWKEILLQLNQFNVFCSATCVHTQEKKGDREGSK